MRFLLFMLLWLAVQAPSAQAEAPANLTVLTDASLMLPLTQLVREYAKLGGAPLTVVVKDSEDAAAQIEQGMEAHVLLTATQPLITMLSTRGLIDVFGTRPIARTQLALVAPIAITGKASLARHISFAAILYAEPNLPIYITPTSTHEGARAASLMEGKEFSKMLTERATLLPSRAAIVKAMKKKPGFALMLATDALHEPSLNVLSLLSDDLARPVNYNAVVLASESMGQARDFIKFLRAKPAQKIFADYGFQPPKR